MTWKLIVTFPQRPQALDEGPWQGRPCLFPEGPQELERHFHKQPGELKWIKGEKHVKQG